MNKGRALGLGIASGLVIISGPFQHMIILVPTIGILLGVLIYVLGITIRDGYEDKLSSDVKHSGIKALVGPYWTVSIVYVFPGILSFIAAFFQNRCFYIICCIVSFFAIAIMGLVIYIIGYPIILLLWVMYQYSDTCSDIGGFCKCAGHDDLTSSGYVSAAFKECAYMDRTVGLFIASTAFIAVAWIFLIACFIVLLVFACRSKPTSGTVYTPAQQPMLAR